MATSKRSSSSEAQITRADRTPASWRRLTAEHPALADAYDRFSDECRRTGPLDASAIALVKLSISVGCGAQRTVHSHAKKALHCGADPDALRQIAFIALPTIGLPAALDALRWIDESIEEDAQASSGR